MLSLAILIIHKFVNVKKVDNYDEPFSKERWCNGMSCLSIHQDHITFRIQGFSVLMFLSITNYL